MSNQTVIATIRAHHEELASQMQAHRAAVLTAARTGAFAEPRDRMSAWCRTELLPHAAAEERTLYSTAAGLEATALLVDGMIAEHRSLVGLIDELARAEDAVDAATAAASAQALFTVHLGKENDLLLPALDRGGVDLGAVLAGMHEILGGSEQAE